MEVFDLNDLITSAAAPIRHVVIDSRHVTAPETLFVALPGRHCDGHDFVADAAARGASHALVRQDWIAPAQLPPIQLLRVPNPLTALQQIAAAYRRQRSATVIAITGSQGKTMLKDMLQCYLSGCYQVVVSPESFNSQIGVPLSLLNILDSHQIAIIEAGISKPHEMAALSAMIAPDHAILTNIGEQHLASLGSRATTLAEKSQLLKAVGPDGWVITPDANALSLPSIKARRIVWSDPDPALPRVQGLPSVCAGALPFVVHFPDGTFTHGELSFGFTYLLDLMAMAGKAAWLLGVPSKVLAERIAGYRPESTRTEIWRAPRGVTLVNRPYCADPQGVSTGLDLLRETPPHGRKHFVFGGFRSSQASDHLLRQLGTALKGHALHRLCLYGDHDFQPLLTSLSTSSALVEHFPSCDAALEALRESSLPGDYILVQGPRKHPVDEVIAAFDDSVSHNSCHINLAAVRHNLSALRRTLQPSTRLMVIVKALAYGTEDVRMAHFLVSCGVDVLGVSYVDEGVALKRSGIRQTVFALNVAPYEVGKAVKWDIEVGVQALDGIEALANEAARQGKCARVHLHVDTGMGRLGCRPEEALSLAKRICALPSLCFEGLMTHFSSADDPQQDAFTRQQIHGFEDLLDQLQRDGTAPRYAHAASSAAALRFPESQFGMVRIGLALYGLHASSAVRATIDLQPALALTSRVVGINAVKAGDSVGYSRRYQVPQAVGKIAVLPLGYFDGRHRHLSEKGHVMIRGQRAPLVGNICMDYLMVDISNIPDVQVGDPVLVFGQDEYGQTLAAEEVASVGGSIVHELVSCLGPRIQRLFVDEL